MTGAFYGGGHSVSTTSDSKRDKKQMERDITRSMFAIRVAEMRHSWNRNKCVYGNPSSINDVIMSDA